MYAFFMAHILGPPPPPQPLQVTSVAVGNLVATSAVITWQTNNTANSRVDFGSSITYDSFASDPALVTNHSITLTGLTANTTYHYQMTSVDGHAQTATSIDATFGTTAANFSLQLSAAADRSASSALQGQTVAGTIYVFTSPASGVTRVRFWLDNPQMSGTPRQTEGAAPWDFAGTAANGTANPTNTTTIPNGSHMITDAVDNSAGGTDVLTSSFTVSNAGPPPPPPSGFSLQVSAAADRSASSALQGRTVAGTIYVFTSPASGVTRVRFWLDNPQMSGTPRQTEGAAPWDFAGTAANGTANPTNTTTIPNGSHMITDAVDNSAGGTDVLTSSFTISNAGPPPPPPSGFSLQVSAAADRSASSALQGRTVAGTIYVFTSPASGVTRVRFWLDNPQMSGTPRQTEGAAPWDFAGTAANGTANPTNTTTIPNGSHTITAAVDKSAGGTDVLTSSFTVSNAGPPPPPPSGFSLQVSAAADRSASSALQGRTVAGTIYVFVSPASGVTRVRFWLDNPQMSGTPRQTEGAAPWDFAGTAANGTANPTNTTTIPNGSHTITAAVDKSAGGTDVLTSTFTVGN